MIKNLLVVGLGGAIGSMLRYLAFLLITTKHFPLATFAVNITGSFIIGLVLAYSLKEESFLNNWKLFLATGICGGFTTFSAFAAENIVLIQNGKFLIAFAYITFSIILGLAATFAGYKLIHL